VPRFLYTLFIAVDANFKLKGKDRGIKDVELMSGLGVFVNEAKYQEHLGATLSSLKYVQLDLVYG